MNTSTILHDPSQLAYAALPIFGSFIIFSRLLDCVEVRWKAELFDAEAVHVHSSGKVDAAYDIDGSEGVILTAKGLK